MIKYDGCLDSRDYIDWLVDTDGACADNFRLEMLPKMLTQYGYKGMWDYPITEIDHLVDNNINAVLVRFPAEYGGYDYRFCEVE